MNKESTLLSEIMTRKVITVGVSEQVEEALRLMIKFDVGSVIVTDKEKPIGIITEHDITRAALRGDSLAKNSCSQPYVKTDSIRLSGYGGVESFRDDVKTRSTQTPSC